MSDPQHPHDLYEAEHSDRRTARIGLGLFTVYLVVYGAFVVLCATALKAMGTRFLGVNVAVVYGFGLILFPFVLAALYLFLTRGHGEDKA
jgi:uncharacterized membrane protein (DUF485 family)